MIKVFSDQGLASSQAYLGSTKPDKESGQPGNRHFSDLIDPWLRGEYHPLLFERQAIEAEAEGTLVLSPDGAT